MDAALIVAGAGAAIAGGLLSGAYQHFRDLYEEPKLQIDYEGTDANKVETDNEIYIRARVRNAGRRTAKGARVFLTSLKEVQPSGTILPTSLYDSKPLAWSGWTFAPRDIPPASRVHFYVDLTRVSKHEQGWLFSVEQLFASQTALQKYSGTYRFQLTLTADNAKPATCEIDVTYKQDWNSLRAESAPKP
jgi:hypothetical protein